LSLRARIFLLVLLATLVPSLAFALYLLEERAHHIEEAKHNLGTHAKYMAENLSDKARGTVQLLHGLSRARELDAGKAACSEFLADVLARYPQYTGLLTATPEGDLHCDSLNTGRKLNVRGRDYFKQVQASLEPAFDVVIGGLTGIAVLQVAYPVLDAPGKLKYVLLGSLNLSEYAQDIAEASQYPGLHTLIWNQKGTLMVRNPVEGGSDFVGKDFAASELFRFAASGDAGTAAELPDLDGVPRVWALGVMPERGGARLTLGISYGDLVTDANRTLLKALAFLTVAALLAFAGASYVAETGIRNHVRRIARAARRIGTDDARAPGGPPYPRGELGELMAVVDRTAEAVQAQRAEIASRNRDLQRLNRTLRVLSGINTLIVRVHDRDELFREACRIATEQGRFHTAWIGIVDPSAMTIAPIAWAGAESEFLTLARDGFSLREDAPLGNSMSARAVREKAPIVSNDIRLDPTVFFAQARKEQGIASMAVLPLLVSDDVVGVLVLYAVEPGFFDEGEMKLLTELAGDIAFAVDHIEKEQKLDYLAYYDVLTGLANQSLFLDRTQEKLVSARKDGRRIAVFVMDIERFKTINDAFGRLAGDELLRQVAGRLLLAGHGDPSRFARVGADRFAIAVSGVDSAEQVGRFTEEQLSACFGAPFRLGDDELSVSVKVGIALFPDDGADAETLLRNAEAALKRAKATGERYLFFTQAMTERIAERLSLETKLRQALDNGGFILHYQPKVSLASGKLTGAEALIRWSDPRMGLVPPSRFIPILEETGLIHEVGRWALLKAIEDHLRWRAAGLLPVRIAVNVSPLQLRSRSFITEVVEAIGVDANAGAGLELEITESLIMSDVRNSIASLEAIRALGVTIAIDDFGTGFSSLSYLAKLPVDTLKIDRAFVTDMTSGPDGLTLVSTIVQLAHSLKLKVVAEGVEREEQSRLLRLLNCDEMQGYLISQPLPADIFEARFLVP
jgi:diguanylate cyclase (GGDEF)-like protein